MNQTFCSGGLRKEPVTLNFLKKDKKVGHDCKEFDEAIVGLGFVLEDGEGGSGGISVVVIAISATAAVLGLVGLLIAVNFLLSRRKESQARRCTSVHYKFSNKDHEEEGSLVE